MMEKQYNKSTNEELGLMRFEARRLHDKIRSLELNLIKKEKEGEETEKAYKELIKSLGDKSSAATLQKFLREKAEYKRLLDEKEQQRVRQKNEFAGVILNFIVDL